MFEIEGEMMVMMTEFAATLPVKALGRHVQSLSSNQYVITAAIDMLVTGF